MDHGGDGDDGGGENDDDLRHSAQGIGTDHALCGRDAGNEQIKGCLW